MKLSHTMLLGTLLGLGSLGLHYANGNRRNASLDRSPARIEPFVTEDYEFAAVTIGYPRDEQSFLIVPSKGRWVSYTAFGAPLEFGVLNTLVDNFVTARGVKRSTAATPHATYGLDPPAFLFELHGLKVLEDEDRDLLASFEIGATVGTGSGAVTYVRRQGATDVWELAFDPRPQLARSQGSSMPPMLDTRLVPGPFPGAPEAQFRYLEVAGQSGVYRLVRRDVEPPPAEGAAWRWTLEDADGSRECSWQRVETYCAFLRLAPYVGLDDPKAAALHGIEKPYFSLRAWPVVGDEALELYLGDAAERVPGRYCLNLKQRLLAIISNPTAAALDPAPEVFMDESVPEPWSVFLEFAAQPDGRR